MNICFDFLSTSGHWQLSKGKLHLKNKQAARTAQYVSITTVVSR